MFQANGLQANGLNPEDRAPDGEQTSVFDPMDGLMSDWSWRPRLRDLNPPVYVYSAAERSSWELFHYLGVQLPALQPWSFPAYRGPVEKPARIGVTR